MTEFGPEIAVGGKWPEWLADDDLCLPHWERTGWAPMLMMAKYVDGWCRVTKIRLPAHHWAYPVIEKGFTPWAGGDHVPDGWDCGEVLFRGGEKDFFYDEILCWGRVGLPEDTDIIGYRKKSEEPGTPSPEWWIAQGRALQAEGKLPAGVVLPEAEIDYERYRAALGAFNKATGYTEERNMGDDDRRYIRGLIAAMPLMPKE